MSLSEPKPGAIGPSKASHAPSPADHPVTLKSLYRMAREGTPFACLTAYDATTARWLQRAGVHMLLAGDSAAEVILGLPRTAEMPLDFAIAITAAVKRGAPDTVVMADMPFGSYHESDAQAVHNAARFIREARADIVKLEADASFAPTIAHLTRAGIPVCAHIGSLPQRAALTSGYTSAGRTAADALRILRDAHALESAGAAMLLIEAVPPAVTEALLARSRIPVIGIGAGPAPHAQILVVHDLLGLTDAPPRFAEPAEALGQRLRHAGEEWVRRVQSRAIGGQGYTMTPEQADLFRNQLAPPSEPPRG